MAQCLLPFRDSMPAECVICSARGGEDCETCPVTKEQIEREHREIEETLECEARAWRGEICGSINRQLKTRGYR